MIVRGYPESLLLLLFEKRHSQVPIRQVFTTFRILYLFVRSSVCRRQNLPKMCTLFCLVLIKCVHFNLLCVLSCFLEVLSVVDFVFVLIIIIINIIIIIINLF